MHVLLGLTFDTLVYGILISWIFHVWHSQPFSVLWNISQGFILIPLPYMQPLASLTSSTMGCTIYVFTDAMQLFASSPRTEIASFLPSLSHCFSNIRNWMTENPLNTTFCLAASLSEFKQQHKIYLSNDFFRRLSISQLHLNCFTWSVHSASLQN